MSFAKFIKQRFKEAADHPDITLVDSIFTNNLDGVRKSFDRGANVNTVYNEFLETKPHTLTPLEIAVFGGVQPGIVAEILARQPDTSYDYLGKPVSERLLDLPRGESGQVGKNALDNFKLLLQAGLQPLEQQLSGALLQSRHEGREDIAAFFAAHSDATRAALAAEAPRPTPPVRAYSAGLAA
jgi:hypothetical protein